MSASLVGSEMCIRDRTSGTSAALTVLTAMPEQSESAFEVPHTASGRAQPVSYTHLTLPTICSV
eukprot:8677489-Alexandrium_andersonii.AAC.1